MKAQVFLAPMSGVTDLSFRLICREFGAKFCFFEMIDVNALVYGHPSTIRLIKTAKKDSPLAGQLLGADPALVYDAAQKLISLTRITSIQLNSACPAKKVIKKKAGAYLLSTPRQLEKILKKLTSNLRLPVTVKLRTASSKSETVKIAKLCEDAGMATVFIHGRTLQQGYSGDVDYESIRAVKNALKIPVFGSGNIFNPILAKKMLDETGCDGILVARGALGNPWIFKDIENYLKHGKLENSPTLSEKKDILLKHLSYIDQYKEISLRHKTGFMGKVAMWYLKGIPHASRIRGQLQSVKSYEELKNIIEML